MGRMNVDSMITFSDGSQLLLSTRFVVEGGFTCQLYVSSLGGQGKEELRVVSNYFEAPTCRQAQDIAYSHARRLYPDLAGRMKEPPYLIWPGLDTPVPSDQPKRRFVQRG